MADRWELRSDVTWLNEYNGRCGNCDEVELKGKYPLVLPWEDGDNPAAYVECPRCRMKNIVEGFGVD